ncbi:MAG TPA: hypothetical protein VMB25_19030 [Bryobacteraceae bacterium]|nr:hypothetical protein [Bryobacteraceae bacterium]
MRPVAQALAFWVGVLSAWGAEPDALAISRNIQARHMPFGTILDPINASSSSDQIVGYTRCGDSALWTGAYLAAEAFRYNVTQSPDALNNVKAALAGLGALSDVTGDNRLARCIVAADSPYAAGIESEEASNTVHQSSPWIWVDNTSRDQIIGAFFGLSAAFDLVNDSGVKSSVNDVVTRLVGYIAGHQWTPNNDLSNTFQLRPEQLQMLLQVAHHVNPANTLSGPLLVLPVGSAVFFDVQDNSSYFKFNLDYMTFYNLLRLQDNSSNRGAYQTVRNYTASHQNAFFNMVDRALNGPDATRDAETVALLDQWLERPKRDFYVDDSKLVAVCGSEACSPVPVPLRPPADFLWQDDPFQLSGGGSGLIEGAGIDYSLPYWMARYYGVITGDLHSAAAPGIGPAPDALASLFGTNLASGVAEAADQPPSTALGGVTLVVTDSADVARDAPLLYVSPSQINFLVPDGTAPGAAQFAVMNGPLVESTVTTIGAVAPALFSMNGEGTGVAAATAISVPVSDAALQTPVPVFQCGAGGCTSVPISLGVNTATYVTFYGTGIRGRSALANVRVTIDGTVAPVLYAGPAPGFTGLDQVNVLLPASLSGDGEANVVLTADGQTSNTVTMNIQ